ncbi:hypothetical protein ACFWY9_16980 [Amycolatopsis sp. NPDC059027]|uniref:hypothetical protein n=1 Tax=Amycolatopsis sp. NPDC059027 TaxID=3346709 RepID=UPI00366CB4D5
MSEAIPEFEDQTAVVGVVVAVGQNRRHGLLHDHSLAVDMEAVKRDCAVAYEQPGEDRGDLIGVLTGEGWMTA